MPGPQPGAASDAMVVPRADAAAAAAVLGASPSGLRRAIPVRVRHEGPRPPEPVAARPGAGRTGVLEQLAALESARLVVRQPVPHGVGRPRHVYDVTADAQ